MQFNIPWHVGKKIINSLDSFMGRTLRNRHVSIIHRVQQSIISDLTRCQPMVSNLPSLSFFSLHSTLPGSVFTAYAIHKFIKHERRCVWTDPSPRRGNFIEEGVGWGRETTRGTISRLFSPPIIPVSCLFYSWNTSGSLYGEQRIRPKIPFTGVFVWS